MKSNRMLSAVVGLLAVVASGQTTHEGETGGKYNTITLNYRSRTFLDREVLKVSGITLPAEELWAHGHSGPRILRIALPDASESLGWKLSYFEIRDGEQLEVDLVDPTVDVNRVIGQVKSFREVRLGTGFLVTAHLAMTGETEAMLHCGHVNHKDLHSALLKSPKCVIAAAQALLSGKDTPDKDIVWITRAPQGFTWEAKHPRDTNSSTIANSDVAAEAVTQVTTDPAANERIEFKLLNQQDAERVTGRELRVMDTYGRARVLVQMPPRGRWTICGLNANQVSECEPFVP